MYIAQGNWNEVVVPKNINDLYFSKEYETLIDSQVYLAQLITKHCPVNATQDKLTSEEFMDIMNKKGYVRFLHNPEKIFTINRIGLISSVYLVYVDETRPWTLIELEEYSQIYYLDNFEKKKYNFHEYKKEIGGESIE